VRMRQQPERLKGCKLVAHRGRRHVDAATLDQRLRADRLTRGDVLLDDETQDASLTFAEFQPGYVHLQGKRSLQTGLSGEQLSGDTAAQEAAATSQREQLRARSPGHGGEAEPLQPLQRDLVDRDLEACKR
jgi:hypothetical protein